MSEECGRSRTGYGRPPLSASPPTLSSDFHRRNPGWTGDTANYVSERVGIVWTGACVRASATAASSYPRPPRFLFVDSRIHASDHPYSRVGRGGQGGPPIPRPPQSTDGVCLKRECHRIVRTPLSRRVTNRRNAWYRRATDRVIPCVTAEPASNKTANRRRVKVKLTYDNSRHLQENHPTVDV